MFHLSRVPKGRDSVATNTQIYLDNVPSSLDAPLVISLTLGPLPSFDPFSGCLRRSAVFRDRLKTVRLPILPSLD